MARGLRWQLKFKSLNGKDCRVNIFKEGYSGEPGYLTGTSDPFTWDEDDSQSPTQWVRTKTGYINLEEKNAGALFGLYPASDTEHYIEAWYGEELEFTGYMQAIDFSQQYVASPRELSFPIQSPLALLDSFNFNVRESSVVTFATLMNEVVSKLNARYERIVYPATGSNGNNVYPWDALISSETICPHKSLQPTNETRTVNSLYEPKSLRFFVEGVCAMMRWQVHDCGNALVFTREDFDGNYYNILVSNLLNPSATSYANVKGNSTSSAPSLWTECDSDATLSMTRPLKTVTAKIDGDDLKEVKLGHNNWHQASGQVYQGGYGYNMIGSEIESSSIIRGSFFNGSLGTNYGGLYPVTKFTLSQDGKQYTHEDKLIYVHKEANTSRLILRWKPYPRAPFTSGMLLKMSIKVGTNIDNLSSQWDSSKRVQMIVNLKYGDKYYDTTSHLLQPASQYVSPRLEFDCNTGGINTNNSNHTGVIDRDGYIIEFYSGGGPYMNGNNLTLELYLDYANSSIVDGTMIEITSLSLKAIDADNPYKTFEKEVTHSNQGGVGETNYTLNFCHKSAGSNYVYSSDMPYGEDHEGVELLPGAFSRHFFLKQRFRRNKYTFNNPYSEYMMKFQNIWNNSLNWRCIAMSRSMRDDETTYLFKSI